MEFYRIVDLTSGSLIFLVKDLMRLQDTLEDKEKNLQFFQTFPFHLLSGVVSSENLILITKLLSFLSAYETFYCWKQAFSYSFEFIMVNLEAITQDSIDLGCVLEVLLKFLNRHKLHAPSCSLVSDSYDRLLENISRVAKWNIQRRENVKYYADIVNIVLTDIDISLDKFKEVICVLFTKFQDYNQELLMCTVCKVVLMNSSVYFENFTDIYNWLIHRSSFILRQELQDDDILYETLQCLTLFIKRYLETTVTRIKNLETSLRVFISDLMKATGNVCKYSSCPRMRESCLQLLSGLITIFFAKNNLYFSANIYDELQQMSENVYNWPESNNSYLFCICHIIVVYGRLLIWKRDDILNAMFRSFYCGRHFLSTPILNSIYFLYPIVANGAALPMKFRILGNDLLTYLEQMNDITGICSNHKQQFKWMFQSTSKNVKINIICCWLPKIGDEAVASCIVKIIKHCRAEEMLLQIILNKELTQRYGESAADLLKMLNNVDLSRNVAMNIPLNMDNPAVLQNLILSGPEIPSDQKQTRLICAMMSCVIPTLKYSKCLQEACIFTRKLLVCLKRDLNAINKFCNNLNNIQYLIEACSLVEDDVYIEIISLLKVLIHIQKIHNVFFENYLLIDLQRFLEGSYLKVIKTINLLTHIMNFKSTLLQIPEYSLFLIYCKVIECSFVSLLETASYDCIVSILRKIPWLSQTLETIVHIELLCSLLTQESVQNDNVLRMVEIWIKLIIKEPCNAFCSIPVSLKNYITRLVDNNQIDYYMKIMQEILRRTKTTKIL